jgi:hypothetical protein
MTQKNLVETLSHFSDELRALNSVTLSRWETGSTSPSIGKKRILLKFLASTGCLSRGSSSEKVRKRFETLLEPLSQVFTRRYQYLIGNYPDFEFDQHFSLHPVNECGDIDDHIDHIIDIEKMTNAPDYYTVSHERMKQWCQHPANFAIICERKKQHIGHFVMPKVHNHVAEAVAYNWRSELSISQDDLCSANEHGSYYIHALYGRNPRIAALLNVQAYLHLFDHIETTDNVVIFSTRKDGVELAKDYGIEMVAKGKDKTFGFKWHGMLSPVEDILFSETVVKLVF